MFKIIKIPHECLFGVLLADSEEERCVSMTRIVEGLSIAHLLSAQGKG
jgi:hypothetical protein